MKFTTLIAMGIAMAMVAACGDDGSGNGDDGGGTDAPPGDPPPDAPPDAKVIRTIFVIPLENKDDVHIYGNTVDAPYLNGMMASTAAHATMFGDELPSLPSEPHYVWMEAGTNAFADHTFTGDGDPSASNSTGATEHLATQLEAAGLHWVAYQEGIRTNTCPISTSGNYAPKHDPFVFFRDIVGSPPSATAPRCSSHHKSYADFAADLAQGLTGYVFVTPDICHDMHGGFFCPSGTGDSSNIKAGDTWLSRELPRIVSYTQAHDDAVIFLTWDEGDSTSRIPFLAIGQHVKPGYAASVAYTHSSMLKSVEELLGVPVLPAVANATDFADMFEPGVFP